MALSTITGVTNAEWWDAAQRISPQFMEHTAKQTYTEFAAKGYENIQYTGASLINEFISVSLMPVLNIINMSHAKNPLEDKGFGEYFDSPNGGIIQRMAINSIKPVSPAYRGIINGNSVDPFVVYKPEATDRFYQYNYDYQSLVTVQDFQIKQIFASDYGMSEFMAGIMEGLRNGYTIQTYENTLEAINAGLNSEKNPLKSTQKITLSSWTDGAPTDDELMEFLRSVMNIQSTFEALPQYDGFNAAGYASTQDTSRLKMLVRVGLKNDIKLQLRVGAYNPGDLALDIDQIEVPHFGGLVPYQDADFTTRLYPVYDSLGHEIGWNTTEGAEEATVTDSSQVYWQDPNKDVIAIIADKGWVFHNRQNPYTVEPIRNPRGMYNNYWANSPRNAINVDSYYNVIAICKPS